MSNYIGQVIGIARRKTKRARMETLTQGTISNDHGLEGDFRGKPGPRQFSILNEEGWKEACKELSQELDWTIRRANLFIKGLDLKKTVGKQLSIGTVTFEITDELDPCSRMEEQVTGLKKALTDNWRGGILCRVISGGTINIDDRITLEETPIS